MMFHLAFGFTMIYRIYARARTHLTLHSMTRFVKYIHIYVKISKFKEATQVGSIFIGILLFYKIRYKSNIYLLKLLHARVSKILLYFVYGERKSNENPDGTTVEDLRCIIRECNLSNDKFEEDRIARLD